jgi:ribonuclease BN (tRNA processing enzyme)
MVLHRITFYPIGNADCTLIALANGQKVLFDYANQRNPGDTSDKRVDLAKSLNASVPGDFRAVCFTHCDDDHICGFSDYFYLEHATKYQYGQRKKMEELWVPAAVLLEQNLTGEARILRSEARCRLKKGTGIRVFSRPKGMKEWCDEQEDISYENVKHLFVDAGTLVPGFERHAQGVEFFVHSPFISETQKINRNREAITVQATFNDALASKLILGSDIDHCVWTDIVNITKYFKNEDRLRWDLFHVSHHSSYLSLGPEKGKEETQPTEEIKWLFETQGNEGCRVISPSWPIPPADTDQPPHRQAANYYKKVARLKKGEYKVTMEHPTVSQPEPMVFSVDHHWGLSLEKKITTAATFASTTPTPRAG